MIGRAVRGLRDLYTARFQRTAARPPATLAQQNTLIQNNHQQPGDQRHPTCST